VVSRQSVNQWMGELKSAWESKDVERALRLFTRTEYYYERPFKAGTTQEDYRGYWKDIVGLQDIRLDYSIVAVEGDVACVHWQNWFREAPDSKITQLDGMFVIEFDQEGYCRIFRQWWFMNPE
jgi:ketosteroid isomerase-like protein